MKKIKVWIIGASWFTWLELIKILEKHHLVEISDILNSETFKWQKICNLLPGLKTEKVFSNFSIEEILEKDLDLIFLATPNWVAMNLVAKFLEKWIKMIDLSADFRFENIEIFEQTYWIDHVSKNLKSTYWLCEINREKIKKSNLIANPWCYVTAAILAIYPIRDFIDTVIIDGKSWWSGAWRKANPKDYEENFVPYKLTGHRHEVEMIEKLDLQKLYFSPWVLSFFRWIVNTIHIFPKEWFWLEEIKNTIKTFYQNENFVKVFDEIPNLKNVKNTNECHIWWFTEKDSRIVFVSMIDNLQKWASGQAVQNMNLIFGFDEKEWFTSEK